MAGESSRSSKGKGKEVKKEKPKREKWYDDLGWVMDALMTQKSRESLSKIIDDPEFIKGFPGGERGRLLRAIDKRERIAIEKHFNEMWLEQERVRLRELLQEEQRMHYEVAEELHSLKLSILEKKIRAQRRERGSPVSSSSSPSSSSSS